jgi:hypothetical protein
MTSFKRSVGSALLAAASVLTTACAPNEADDLHGMTRAVQGLCVDNATEREKWNCVVVADEQATFLANYVGPKGEFKQACDFSRPPEVEGSVDAVLAANASRIRSCLDKVEEKGSPAVRHVADEIHKGLSRGLR